LEKLTQKWQETLEMRHRAQLNVQQSAWARPDEEEFEQVISAARQNRITRLTWGKGSGRK
jgi:hypothetical protein